MSINYLYDIPGLGKKLGWKKLGLATDNWQLSGITTFQTGAPFLPGFTTTNGENITGSTDSAPASRCLATLMTTFPRAIISIPRHSRSPRCIRSAMPVRIFCTVRESAIGICR